MTEKEKKDEKYIENDVGRQSYSVVFTWDVEDGKEWNLWDENNKVEMNVWDPWE